MDIRIDKIRVRAAGMNPDTARQLGRLLAEQLATAVAAAPPEPDATQLTRLRVTVPGPAGQHTGGQHTGGRQPGSLVPAMAAEVLRALRTATGTSVIGTPTAGAAATAGTMPARPGAAR